MTPGRDLDETQNEFPTPTIEEGVSGLRGEEGLFLRAPRLETLLWDLGAEIGSSRSAWLEDRNGWWIDASYRETVIALVLRSFPSVLLVGPNEDRLLSRDGRSAVQGRLL